MYNLKFTRKNQKGVTLVALVVTIVILLILAGITVITLSGENGIISKAMKAKEATQKGEATDIINLKITNIQLDSFAKTQKMPTLQYLADSLCEDNEIEYVELESKNTASLEKINVGENASIFTKLKQYPYEFEINSSLQIASVEGKDTNTELEVSDEQAEFRRKISEAISSEGVETDYNASADTMANNIKSIFETRTSDATASEEDIAKDKTAYVNGNLITGTYSKNTSNICFTGSGGSGGNSWTTVGYNTRSVDSNICTSSGSTINFLKDCKIKMYVTLFAGRRSNGTTNSAYFRVFVNDSVVYTSEGYENQIKTVIPLNEYEISSGSTMYVQVYGTDQTYKMHAITIETIE